MLFIQTYFQLSQPNVNPIQSWCDHMIELNPFHPTHRHKLFIHFQTTKEANIRYANCHLTPTPHRTEQNRMGLLGLSASLLAGGTARLPQLLPGPGQQLTRIPELKSSGTPAPHFPFAGWRASPALCAMQEPIPDFS
jgi:hypothetical protein